MFLKFFLQELDFSFKILQNGLVFSDFFVFDQDMMIVFFLDMFNDFKPFTILEFELFILFFEVMNIFKKFLNDFILLIVDFLDLSIFLLMIERYELILFLLKTSDNRPKFLSDKILLAEIYQ
jgi:hypothetical protein